MTADDAAEGRLAAGLKAAGVGSWLFLLVGLGSAVAVVAPWTFLGLPLLFTTIGTVYLRVLSRHVAGDELRGAVARSQVLVRRLMVCSASTTALVAMLMAVGGWAFTGGLVLVGLELVTLAAGFPLVFQQVDDADVPRVLHDRHPLRYLLRALLLERLALRKVGSAELPRLFVAALLPLLFALLGQAATPAIAQGVVEKTFPKSSLVFDALRLGTTSQKHVHMAPDSAATATLAPPAPTSVPTELPVSPCPREEQVLATMSSGIPADVGKALFKAWHRYGGAVIGCPDEPPHRVGQLWVQPLENGQDTPSEVVYGAGHGAAVLSDFYNVTLEVLPKTAWVEDRVRWGLGTLQLLHIRGGCRLAERYEQDGSVILLPAAVSAGAIELGYSFGAVPWVRSQTPVTGGVAYEVHFIAPGNATHPYRDLRTITFRYVGSEVIRGDSDGVVATEQSTCPEVVANLAATAKQVEHTVQLGHG